MTRKLPANHACIIGLICLACGAIVGPMADLGWRETFVPEAVIGYSILVLIAGFVSLPFALLAALQASFIILLIGPLASRGTRLGWTVAGGILGGVCGVLHPLCLLSALSERLAGDPALPDALRLGRIVGWCGMVAGALVAWWYHGQCAYERQTIDGTTAA